MPTAGDKGDRDLAAHWDGTYAQGETTRSWFETEPVMSLRMLDVAGVTTSTNLVDVGGGTSRLVDELLARGHLDLTVLDISGTALRVARDRLGAAAGRVRWIISDIGAWLPSRRYGAWHDRAVLQFLTTEGDQARYLDTLHAATEPGSVAVIGCFAPDGPTHCSGLPVVRRSAADLSGLLGPEWGMVAEDREQHPTPSGATQWFTWAAFTRSDAARLTS
jgi:trans-aconitate methyltransferase